MSAVPVVASGAVKFPASCHPDCPTQRCCRLTAVLDGGDSVSWHALLGKQHVGLGKAADLESARKAGSVSNRWAAILC